MTSEPTNTVLGFVEDVIEALDTSPSHRFLMRRHLSVTRAQAENQPLPAIVIPLFVCESLTGTSPAATQLAGACLMVYMGADLFDNVVDDELEDPWKDDASRAMLAAATFLSVMPHHVLDGIEMDSDSRCRIEQAMSEGLLKMSAGQYDDMRLAGEASVSLRECRAISENKAGSQFGFYAEAAAILAQASGQEVRDWHEFGRCLGTAVQISSDVLDLLSEGPSRDLTNGKKTLPIVHALSKAGSDKSRLGAALAQARDDPKEHESIKHTLIRAGSFRYAALVVEVYRQGAERLLNRLGVPSHSPLRELVSQSSLVANQR